MAPQQILRGIRVVWGVLQILLFAACAVMALWPGVLEFNAAIRGGIAAFFVGVAAKSSLLLAMLIMNVRVASSRNVPAERAVWWIICAGTLFMLLEELDYGQHYIEFLRGLPPEQRSTLRSVQRAVYGPFSTVR